MLNINSSKIYLKNEITPKKNPFNQNINKVLIEVMDIGSQIADENIDAL